MTQGKKIKKIEKVLAPGTKVYDFEVEDAHHYIFSDGTISHNSYVPMKKMGGGCLISGTKIQTPTGLEEIQNIKTGDVVSTLFGDQKVVNTFRFDDKEVFEVTFEDGSKIECSGDHKFLVKGRWVSVFDMLGEDKNINIEVSDITGDLNVYRQQIYQNLFFFDEKGQAA